MSTANKVLIADDHPLFRDAMRHVLNQAFAHAAITEAASQDQVLALVRDDDAFDLVLLDISIPGASKLSCLKELRKLAPLTPIVVVSGDTNPATMRAAFESGATGYVPKSAPSSIMVSALNLVLSGGVYVPPDAISPAATRSRTPEVPEDSANSESKLSQRQQVVLRLMAEGKANKEIARTLSISEVTVKAHVSIILRKLGVDNRVQAALAARRLSEG